MGKQRYNITVDYDGNVLDVQELGQVEGRNETWWLDGNVMDENKALIAVVTDQGVETAKLMAEIEVAVSWLEV